MYTDSTSPRVRHQLLLLLIAMLATLLLAAPSPATAADDYPAEYRDAAGFTLDRWGFEARTPYSFMAWRLEQRGFPVSNGSGWWLMIADGDLDRLRRQVIPFTGGRIDQTPAVGALARWPAVEPGGYGFSSWVTAVNPDGSVETESYSPEVGYTTTTASPPWFIHLPAGARTPNAPTAPRAGVARLGTLAMARRQLTMRVKLPARGTVRVAIRHGARPITLTRRVPAGQRLIRIKIPRNLPRGRYRVTVRVPAGDSGATRTYVRSVRKLR